MKGLKVDRSTGLVVGVLVVLLAAYFTVMGLAREYAFSGAPPSSVFSASPDGLKVLFGYLRELGLEPRTLQSLEEMPKGGTIVAVGPFQKAPTRSEAQLFAGWVREGGRLVLAGEDGAELARQMGASASAAEANKDVLMRPVVPGDFASGIKGVDMGRSRLLGDSAAWVSHYKDISGQGLLSQAVGRGELVWLASPYPMTNDGIGKADNARLATLLAASAGPVYFDEYHHGFVSGGSVWQRMGPNGRAGVVLLAVALVLALASSARRLGPPIPEAERGGVRASGYIAALAELYRKAGARREALKSLEDGLVRALAKRHGNLPGGVAAHPSAGDALAASDRARSAEEVDVGSFLEAARALSRARREVEGRDG